ncbi:MAG: hypothetical protein WBE72_13505 [Terracidiphilus sp.]
MAASRDGLLQPCFRELAAHLKETGTRSSVLHGIDPITGNVGRDLDLYIPDRAAAAGTALAFADILKRNGFHWVTLADPVWGHRCVGVTQPEYFYCELHILSTLRHGPLDFGSLFELSGQEEALGLVFDPAFWFAKSCFTKYSTQVMQLKPIWEGREIDPFSLSHREEIERRFGACGKAGQEFVRLALSADSHPILVARKRALRAVLWRHCAAHPMQAADAAEDWLVHKISRYFSPCVPAFCLLTSQPPEKIQSQLEEKLEGIFLEIWVGSGKLGALERRRLLGRQSLLVHSSSDARHKCGSDLALNAGSGMEDDIDIDKLCREILDAFVDFNRRWKSDYAQRGRTYRGAKLGSV